MKLRKRIAATAAAAAICATMVSGMAVTAEEYTYSESSSVISELYAQDPIYTEIKSISGAKYSSAYIKLAEKYRDKEAKNTITYSKSRTKKFWDKYTKAISSDKPEFNLYLINKDMVMGMAAKDDKIKVAMYAEDTGLAMYVDSSSVTMLDPSTKMSVSAPNDGSITIASALESAEILDAPFKDTDKGKIFKFKYKDNSYVYEEFDGIGILFTSKGTAVALTDETGTFCCRFSYSVKDSVFDIPDGYTDMTM